jgi:pyruvate/2-oxoacid:ferredoxin oxidoreductase beta subunit
MNNKYLLEEKLPFCKGCGHSLIAMGIDKSLQELNCAPLDVILVTDIGCHGIVDKCFTTHTIHGLHGRSVALAAGISMSLQNTNKKVIVFIGDGGATIGMQHLLDAAHNNFNMTVIVHNNMLYGMTGGQQSEFTPLGFKTPTLKEGADHSGYDICEIVTSAGASYVSRVLTNMEMHNRFTEAISNNGFSLVEVLELCPSYGVKSNPGMKLLNIANDAGIPIKVYCNKKREPFKLAIKDSLNQLISKKLFITPEKNHKLSKPISILLCGSAGEGVQTAAELFTLAAIKSGLHATKKSSYPVTVGIGFSSAEIILSPNKILYTGSSNPDFAIITSADGLDYSLPIIKKAEQGELVIDSSLTIPETKMNVVKNNFRSKFTSKFAALNSLIFFLEYSGIFSKKNFMEVCSESKLASKISLDELFELEPIKN